MSRALSNFGRTCGVMLLWVAGISALAATLAFASDPRPDITRESVDAIELQSMYSYCEETEKYTLTFAQLLFRRWDDQHSTHVIEAWRMTRQGNDVKDRIEIREFGGKWEARFWDGSHLRVVTANSYYETWAEWDREVFERERLPPNYRRELRK